MFRKLIRNFKKHLEMRRKWNRTRFWMRDCAEGRLIVSLYATGALKRGMRP